MLVLTSWILMCLTAAAKGEDITTTEGTTALPEPRVYHGVIKEDAEDGAVVELDRQLYIHPANGAICGFTVFKTGALPVPFQVLLTDASTGKADVILSKDKHLNYELTQSYQFEISADDCETGAHSPIRDTVHIEVEDVNDFVPVWRESTYLVEATEGLLYQKLLKLEAIDGDGSEKFSKICSYSLLTTSVPFRISDDGYLQNTQPLDYSTKHNYILEVVAEDCGHKRSDKLLVNIVVKPECRIGWKGVKNNIDYQKMSSRVALTENATLELCGASCELKEVSVRLKLIPETAQQSGCALDTQSLTARDKFCGVKESAVHLLPEKAMLAFDGKTTSYDVKEGTFSNHLGRTFTISTWLKHKEETSEMERRKQHLICSADEEGMNRHHYSLFIHNCRLILLLRREPGEGDPDIFLPAEWRWKLEEVCDGAWHHYALTMEFPQARLYVDGRLVVNGKHHPDIIDDWPLHASKRAHGMKLVVGACWEGGEHEYGQHLKGELADMKILNNATEDDDVIQCINSCHEKLDFHAIADMESGMSISMNSEMSQLSMTGHTKQSVEKLFNRVGYVNPAPRNHGANTLVIIDTAITCSDDSHLSVGSTSTVINLSTNDEIEADSGPLVLSGSEHLTVEEKVLEQGLTIFADVTVMSSDKDKKVDADKRTLKSCVVHMEPDLDPLMEKLQFSSDLSTEHNVKISSNLQGLDIVGPAKIADFQTVLRNLYYHHDKPILLKSRKFSLMCALTEDLSTTNQFTVEASVIHIDPQQIVPVAAGHAAESKFEQAVLPEDERFNFARGAAPAAKLDGVNNASSGVGMIFIAVFSIGFLLFILIVVVLRIRATHLRTGGTNLEDKPEMEWDNSALTITVNPMDKDDGVYEETELAGLHTVTHDSDDDIGSYHDDDGSSSEEEGGEKEIKGLEWDNTNVSY